MDAPSGNSRPKKPGWYNTYPESKDLLPFKSIPKLPPSSKEASLSPQAVSECANSMNYLSRIIIFLSQEARYPSHDKNFKYYPTVSVRQRPKKGTTASYHGVFCSDGNISGIRLKL